MTMDIRGAAAPENRTKGARGTTEEAARTAAGETMEEGGGEGGEEGGEGRLGGSGTLGGRRWFARGVEDERIRNEQVRLGELGKKIRTSQNKPEQQTAPRKHTATHSYNPDGQRREQLSSPSLPSQSDQHCTGVSVVCLHTQHIENNKNFSGRLQANPNEGVGGQVALV